jgi:non-ribosomal peptide synthetase component F
MSEQNLLVSAGSVPAGNVPAPNTKLWAGSLHLINGYGPSGTTIAYTAASVARDGSNQGSIGRGLGCLTWIVDPKDHDRLVPIGAVGEPVIQGEIVGRGYLNEPEKTSAIFISNPEWAQTSTQGCGRMYKTGHLVGYDDVGCLIYIGREDNQVKLRGQRLELGEVEHHLETSASGWHGLCFVLKQGPLANLLVAVVGPDSLVSTRVEAG